ncbi:peroxisomal membrane protein pex16 (peroxin-16) [Moniliophthora roreri MCA 2997]|uniref:Peroxisomal membrane protein PEX16 n=2 Tax=Moniliophthora roreri TaxID=221103 RepID=V2XFE0_MONRO|nr:peroxisomal membrane protein pex16 (peroxin-16) [Moniliophthora roreri MCA 2997]KAI3622311.1 peroxisomal membrane protein pex16 (peroxin-16) [Moniliophthora roreri]
MSSSLASYESFLLSNVSTISTLESSLRSLSWFLPGRFKDAELASEALSASLNMMSMYHDTLLARLVKTDPNIRALLPSSMHTRFTRAWADKDCRYKWIARILEIIRFTELVVEMGLRRRLSNRSRWRGIVLLEILKALLRLALLRITKRPLLSPPIPEREIDPTTLPPDSYSTSSTLAPSSTSASPPKTPDHLKNNKVPLPPHPLLTTPPTPRADTSVEDYLLPKALTTASVKSPTVLIRPLSSSREWLAEILYTLRPLVYASMLAYDRRSKRPLVAALALELLSRSLRRDPPSSAALERSEYARRDRELFWYLFRGSIWDSYTKPKLEALADRASNTPLLSLFGTLMKDWIPLLDEYYYYTAP